VPCPRHFHSLATLGDLLLLFGGYTGSNWLADLHCLHLPSRTWIPVQLTRPGQAPAHSPSPSTHFAAIPPNLPTPSNVSSSRLGASQISSSLGEPMSGSWHGQVPPPELMPIDEPTSAETTGEYTQNMGQLRDASASPHSAAGAEGRPEHGPGPDSALIPAAM